MSATIRRISFIRGLGIFRNYACGTELPDFREQNLIYGFNGCGKTTLSRIFASIEAGQLSEQLPSGGQFEIELTDGSTVSQDANLNALAGRLLVFNTDFVDENLHFKRGTARPLFYVGRAQAQLARELEAARARLDKAQAHRSSLEETLRAQQRAFSAHKRDNARRVAEQLGLGRKYDASDLTFDYSINLFTEAHSLSSDEQEEARSVVAQSSPLEQIAPVESVGGIWHLFREVHDLLPVTLGTEVLKELSEHRAMFRWILEGANYHKGHQLGQCLLCGGEFTTNRLTALREQIDDRFDQLIGRIGAARGKCQEITQALTRLRHAVPSINDVAPHLKASLDPTARLLGELIDRFLEALTLLSKLLERKANTPNLAQDGRELLPISEATHRDQRLAESVQELNQLIQAHNESQQSFEQTKEAAARRLRGHLLYQGQEEFLSLEKEVEAATRSSAMQESECAQLLAEVETIAGQVRDHGPAAEIINRMLYSYLGHNELMIAATDEGYEMRRHGQLMRGHLSEGEKTALALCYFLCTLQAESRQRKDLIVVMDDPVSSLDSRALHYAFSIIRAALEGSGQLVVLTHNLHFMNEVKKWLKKRVEKGTATLFFLEAKQDATDKVRSSILVKMPTLIRDYDSEYQYLFHLVWRFVREPTDSHAYSYLLPNAMRKVLEIFLAFKVPGSHGLASKVDALAKGEANIDPARLRALDRLVQLESHADDLEDLISLSALTIEETQDAANALMNVMETVDHEHFRQLCRLCG